MEYKHYIMVKQLLGWKRFGMIMAVVDVTHLSQAERNKMWIQIDGLYKNSLFTSYLDVTTDQRDVFMRDIPMGRMVVFPRSSKKITYTMKNRVLHG